MHWGHGNDDIPVPDFSQFSALVYCNIMGYQFDWTSHVVAENLDLSGRDLRGARINILGGILRNINFDGANLEGADFHQTTLVNCSFRGANLIYAILPPSPDSDLTDAVLGGIAHNLTARQIRSTWNFKNKDFSNIFFIDCYFPIVEYDSHFNFTNMRAAPDARVIRDSIKLEEFRWQQLPRIAWHGEHAFRTIEFRQRSLHGLTFSGIDFRDQDFSGFTIGFFENCRFDNANFEDVERRTFPLLSPGAGGFFVRGGLYHEVDARFGFRSSNVTREQIEQTRFWKRRDLSGIILENMNLDGWDFSNQNLTGASLEGSSVRGANFENAILVGTNLSVQSMLRDGYTTRDALEYSRNWETQGVRFRLSTLTVEQLMQTRSWKEKRIRGCTFVRVDFDNADLSGIDFTGTVFIGCSFNNANFTGAIMPLDLAHRNVGVTEKQIRSLRNFDENLFQPRDKKTDCSL